MPLSKEILDRHYAEYASQPDAWVSNMQKTKHSIVVTVLRRTGYKSNSDAPKIAVMGVSDKRYLSIHHNVFTSFFSDRASVTTLDIDTIHLGGETETEITHDITKPFPKTPFDVVFSHELMKFLSPNEQLEAIQQSFMALQEPGLAMHILHEPSLLGTSELRSWQYRVDPDELIFVLNQKGVSAVKIIFDSDSDVAWLRKTTVVVLQKP